MLQGTLVLLWHTVLMGLGTTLFSVPFYLSFSCHFFSCKSLFRTYFFHFYQKKKRLFSCGTSKDGESHIVEWNESEGAVKRTYLGVGKRSVGVVQFDTAKNRILAAGDEFKIKFWDMDHVNVLSIIDADGGLPVIIYLTSFTF